MGLLRSNHQCCHRLAGQEKLGRTGGDKLENQSANCVRLMLSGGVCQSIRPLKPAWSFDFHFPILASMRTGDGDPPVSCFVAKCVLDAGSNLLAQLRITEVLQFDCDSHRAILSKSSTVQQLVQTGQRRAGWASQALPQTTYSQFLFIKMQTEEK